MKVIGMDRFEFRGSCNWLLLEMDLDQATRRLNVRWCHHNNEGNVCRSWHSRYCNIRQRASMLMERRGRMQLPTLPCRPEPRVHTGDWEKVRTKEDTYKSNQNTHSYCYTVLDNLVGIFFNDGDCTSSQGKCYKVTYLKYAVYQWKASMYTNELTELLYNGSLQDNHTVHLMEGDQQGSTDPPIVKTVRILEQSSTPFRWKRTPFRGL